MKEGVSLRGIDDRGRARWPLAWLGAVITLGVALSAPGAEEGVAGLMAEARTLLGQGRLDDAEARYQAAARLAPGDWKVHLEVADFYFNVRLDCRRALGHYDVARRDAPPMVAILDGVYQASLKCLEGQGRWEEAIALCDAWRALLKSERRHRRARAALRRRAENEARANALERAEATLLQVLRDDYEDARAHMLRAHVRYSLGRFEQALADYRVIKQTFGSPLIDLYLGITLGRLGRHREALVAFEASLEVDGEFPETWRWIAASHEGRDDPVRAEEAYRRCLELGVDDPRLAAEVRNNLAWLIVKRSRPNAPQLVEALRLARDAVEASQGQVAAYTDTLSEVYLRLGAWAQAHQWARASVRLEPSSPTYLRQLERVEARRSGYAQPGGRVRLDAGSR